MAQKCPKCGYEGESSTTEAVGNAAKGAAAGAAVGSLVPVVGTAIGAGIGGFLGLFDSTTYVCKKCHHQWKG
ncbi:hypothetical protein QJU23_04175 [Pasteurella atlantica]|uniref:Uncharacterized protein n=2 Tax=Pasteurellaceae TaxID=712 RepID=A0ACC6HLE9_9PAST|nr:glycine zipper domain-containing protein [Pasteurella atlantica]MDP8051623.1 hypothetical protein [Pasteurella atlantica]MDP8100484.1 hypothetical protein [Pasteurella atlantica]MDP8104798.1 hypothetical protein [Pasteurella atlantica]MDP8148172.1 hypothetical protein [Pasteurella atlantica]